VSAAVTMRVWLSLARHRSAPGSASGGAPGGGRLPSVLAVVAFAAATWAALTVAGGTAAFVARAQGVPLDDDARAYPVLAAVSCVLLAVPVWTLGAAAARLTVARRNLRLARLRLVGATAGQVTVLALLDAALEALAGAAAGAVGWLASVPLLARVNFQGRPFGASELLLPAWGVAATVAAVLLIALLSCAGSLRKVAVTPLGVVRRVTPPHLRLVRALPLVVLAGGFALGFNRLAGLLGDSGHRLLLIGVVLGFVGGAFAVYNLVGPLLVGLVGRLLVRAARTPATLLAARRLVDDPRSAWRGVGGIALVTFVAGLLSIVPGIESGEDPHPDPIATDIGTGALATLAIAALMAAVSTGVTQAARVLDQAPQYRALHRGGVDVAVLHAARSRETWLPLAVTVGGAGVSALVLISPFLTVLRADAVRGVGVFVVTAVGGAALVLVASRAGRPLVTAAAGTRPPSRS